MGRDRDHSAATTALVTIVNSLAEGYDPLDLFSGLTADCTRLLDIASAGLLLADGHGVLHLMAASSERTHDLELFQLQRAEGPCLDCYHGGTAVSVPDLAAEERRWPQFVPAATAAGFRSVHAVPMRLRETMLGTLGLFGTTAGALDELDLALGQALAHVASIALMTERVADDRAAVDKQLHSALRARTQLQQAKGVLAEHGHLDMDQALTALRAYARTHGQRLSEVARAVMSRELPARHVLAQGPP